MYTGVFFVPKVIKGGSKEGSKGGNKGEEIRHANPPHTAKCRQLFAPIR